MKTIEIEIQVNVKKVEKLLDFLDKNADFKGEKHQIDQYFSPTHRNFLDAKPIKEWLRLRESDGKFSINYKNWKFDDEGKSNYCDELETKIENIEVFKKILKTLDFKTLVTVDKARKIWTYKNYEISVDLVKNLGDFVEIEYYGKDNEQVDPKKITTEMIKFLKEIGCKKIERNYVGYPFMLLFPDEVKSELC